MNLNHDLIVLLIIIYLFILTFKTFLSALDEKNSKESLFGIDPMPTTHQAGTGPHIASWIIKFC